MKVYQPRMSGVTGLSIPRPFAPRIRVTGPAPPVIIEDFEDGNLDDYTGDTGQFTVLEAAAYHGVYGLEAAATGGGDIFRTDIPADRGFGFSAYMRMTGAGMNGTFMTLLTYGVQDIDNWYGIGVYFEMFMSEIYQPKLVLYKMTGGAPTLLGSVALPGDGFIESWHIYYVIWTAPDVHRVICNDAAVEFTENDATYSEGGFGVHASGSVSGAAKGWLDFINKHVP